MNRSHNACDSWSQRVQQLVAVDWTENLKLSQDVFLHIRWILHDLNVNTHFKTQYKVKELKILELNGYSAFDQVLIKEFSKDFEDVHFRSRRSL